MDLEGLLSGDKICRHRKALPQRVDNLPLKLLPKRLFVRIAFASGLRIASPSGFSQAEISLTDPFQPALQRHLADKILFESAAEREPTFSKFFRRQNDRVARGNTAKGSTAYKIKFETRSFSSALSK